MEIENAAPAAADAVVAETSVAEPTPSAEALEPTPRGSVDRAFDKVFADDDGSDEPQEAPASDDRPRGPDGKFIAKEQAAAPDDQQQAAEQPVKDDQPKPDEKPDANDPFAAAPDRFSPDAKAAWAQTPLPVRAEMNRAMSEMAQGLEHYRNAFEPYKQLDQRLQQTGQNIGEVFDYYSGMENLLRQDPVAGFQQIAQNLGLRLEDVAAYVLQQPAPDGAQQHHEIQSLRQHIASLEQQIRETGQTIQQQRVAEAERMVANFAAAHPRVDELGPDIARLIQTGMASTLEEAYDMAERLKPAPQTAASPVPQPAPTPQTRRGQALAGAPAGGSNPSSRKPSGSARGSVDYAFSALGIG